MNPPTQNMVMDPVCGRQVDPGDSPEQTEFNGFVYYFCGERCRREFLRHPRAYSRHPGQPANWFKRLLHRMGKANQRAAGSGELCKH